MILEKLKTATADVHKRLETAPVLKPFSETNISEEAYCVILKKFYGYFFPLEQLIENHTVIKHFLPDLEQRRKASLLKADLRFMSNSELSEITICSDLPEVSSAAQAFGCLYVLEGSTLGGQLLTKVAKRSFDLQTDAGVLFFSGYKQETGSKWKSFRASLEAFNEKYNEESEIIESANLTFLKFYNWLNDN